MGHYELLTGIAAGVLAAAVYFAAGLRAEKMLKINYPAYMKYPYAFALASVLFGSLIFMAGFIKGSYSLLAALVFIAAGAGVCFKEIIEMLTDIKKFAIRFFKAKQGIYEVLFRSLIAICGIYTLAAVLLPPVYYDSLVYHLAVPYGWTSAGALVNTPDNIFSYFPGLLYANYLPFLFLGGHTAVKTYQAVFGLMLLFTAAALTEQLKGSVKTVLVLLLTFPLFFLNVSRVTAEMPLAFFEMGAILIILRAAREDSDIDLKTAFMLGVMLAGAIGVKYTGAIVYCAVLVFMIHLFLKEKLKSAVLAMACLLPLFLFVPYAARNFAWTGNPVYPFFSGVFASAPDMASAAAGYVSHVNGFGLEHSIKNFFLSPFYLVFKSGIFGGDILSPVIIIAPFLIFAAGMSGLGGIIFFGAFMFTAWFFTGEVLRFLLTPCVLAIVLAAVFAARNKNIFVNGVLAALIVFQAATAIYFGEKYLQPFSGIVKNTHEYLTQKITYYKAAQFINRLPLAQSAKVLFVGEARTYYCERRVSAATVFNDAPFAAGLRDKIDANDITLINFTELTRLKTAGYAETYKAVFSKDFKDFMEKRSHLIYNDENCMIWKSKEVN